MPPQRTIPPAKAIKTERTHEENQERAYIAASRRSDRSLEARVESARRASEIHKRRTGRSLRVTEQDVVNEEMYEEEDDDLPLQYRRLTAHLQTGSADFNRRLAAYLTNHVAMRSALDQAITNSYAQQYPNAPQFPHNHQASFPSPMIPQGMMQPSQRQHSIPQVTHPYRQSPYPNPSTPSYRQHPHNRSASIATTTETPSFSQNPSGMSAPTDDKSATRRMSMPAPSTSPLTTRTPLAPQPSSAGATPEQTPSIAKQENLPSQSMLPPKQQLQPQQPLVQQYNPNLYQDFSPFSTALPAESQMLLGSTLDPNDPFTAMLMGGHDNLGQGFYSNPGDLFTTSKQNHFHPSYDGMNATLAPSALDISPTPSIYNEAPSSTTDSAISASSYMFDGSLTDFKGVHYANLSTTNSGTVTPGIDGGWESFINDNSWAENAT